MEKLWKKNLLDIKPYTAGEQPNAGDFIKLNANENPYPPSPAVIKAIREFDGDQLRKYPDASARKLREIIAKRNGLNAENIFVGNGSDDVLALSFRAFFNSDKEIFFPDITYSFYPVWCSLLKISYKTIPVDENFRIRPEDYKPENGGVVIPNPNAPTSIGESFDFVRTVLEENRDCIVIIDEAYVDFSKYGSAVGLIKEYDNLLVVQTCSKSRSLAGLRVGMAMGSEELISVLEAAKDSYNSYPLDSIAQTAAIASFEDEEYFKNTVNKIIRTRDSAAEKLRTLGFTVADSSANFLFCTHMTASASVIFEYLRNKGIYIRYFKLPRIDNFLRITIGTDEEMSALTIALEEFLM